MSRVRVEVIGAVQGVGFRWFAREVARRLDLAGWVRNRDDGSVEITVEGEDSAVERFLAQVERGPRGARVDELRRHPLREVADAKAPLGHPFEILR
ncbi:MAG TPA: acylphosphatase [Gemmatimonadaceae bacterium]|nr:acylphosphatase [Gemmatimonadaceae bacterium]